MENDLLIQNGSEFYTGGNQGWFFKDHRDIAEYGCGIIAICNFLMCFWKSRFKSNTVISKESFIAFVMLLYKKYLFILNMPFIKGMTGFSLSKGLNRYFKDNSISMKAKWGYGCNILQKVNKSLKAGLPVILGVGPDVLGFLKKNKGIKAVDIENGNVVDIYAHYVLIYECKEETEDTCFCISSWGRKYKIYYSEFIKYQKSTVLGFLLSNILEIQNIF